MKKKYLVEYNNGDDNGDNWLHIVVEATSPEEAEIVARCETRNDGNEYICTGEVK